MAISISRLFNFTNWQSSNPTTPLPGNQVDAEIEQLRLAVISLSTQIDDLRRSDGALKNGVVTNDALAASLLTSITSSVQSGVSASVTTAQSSAASATASAATATTKASEATSAAISAQAAADILNANSNSALQQVIAANTSIQSAKTLIDAQAASVSNNANSAAGSAALADSWAEVSQAWAEHMPGTIPPNILAVMGITGDHWSARWWTNQVVETFGNLIQLYAGASATAPTLMPNGDALPTGAIYFNTVVGQMYVRSGSNWIPITQPTQAAVASLFYSVTNYSTTFFTLSTADKLGNTAILTTRNQYGVQVTVNGVRKVPSKGAFVGDYTVSVANNRVTFASTLPFDALVVIDILVDPDNIMTPGVTSTTLKQFVVNGSTATFELRRLSNNALVSPASVEALTVWVDGLVQRPGVDFTLSGSNITFTDTPAADSEVYATVLLPQ